MYPDQIAASTPDKAALSLDDAVMTYAELAERSRRLAAFFRHLGVRRGDVVALQMMNGFDFLVIAWAAQRSGLYYVPIATRLTPEETAYILADSGAAVFITDGERAPGAAEAAVIAVKSRPAAAPHLSVYAVAAHGGETPLLWSAVDACGPALDNAALHDPVEGGDMLYTSGTTGRPKGVRRPLDFVPLGSEARRVERARVLFDMDADTVFLSPAPLYHAAPLRFVMNLLRMGGTVVLMRKFEARAALDTLVRHRVTHSQWVPTMFVRMLDLPPGAREGADLSAHRVAIHAGAPCPVAVKRAMIDWWGPILHEYYAGTESIGLTHVRSAEWLQRPGTVGKAWRSALHIVDEDGGELGPRQVGAVYFSGGAPLNYHNAPEKTAAASHAAGWATMGDMGYVDEEGYLFLTDRKAFTIISGGVNVYPKEIEDVLLLHANVADTAVFGVPDDDLGEAVLAVVEPRAMPADTNAARIEAESLLAFLRGRLAGFKCPKFIDFCDTLPRLDTGKLEKHKLRAAYADSGKRGHRVR